MTIPVMKVSLGLGPGLLPYLESIESNGTYSNFGPQVSAMESEFSAFFGIHPSRLVSASNATLALQGAMAVLDQSSWVVPSWTFAATAHAALLQRGSVSFGDISVDSWTLDPSEVREGEGAVVTAPFGAEIIIDQDWNHVSGLVIDAAAALASFPTVLPNFIRPWAIVVSLHATKLLGIGEGGIAIFSDESLASEFRKWTNFGFHGSREASIPSTNGKLDELSAAVARFRLSKWPEEREDWVQMRSVVHSLAENLGINPPFSERDWVSPYWIVNLPNPETKSKLVRELASNQIESRDWWSLGCHRMPAFSGVPARSDLANSERTASLSLGLPFYRGLGSGDVRKIAGIMQRCIGGPL